MNPSPPATYLVRRGSEQFGPYPFADLQRYATEGRVLPSDLAWTAGMPAWESVGRLLAQHGSPLPPPLPAQDAPNGVLIWIIPIGRSALSLIAGYLGLFSLGIWPLGPFAILLGVLALRDLKRRPKKLGRGRTWFGIIAGAIATLCLIVVVLSMTVLR